jgi:hypothetical protein
MISIGVTHHHLTARAASEYPKNGGNPPIYRNTRANVLHWCYGDVLQKIGSIASRFADVTRVTRFPGNKTYRGTYPSMYLIINIGVTVLHIYIINKKSYYYYRVIPQTARNTSRNTCVTPESFVLRLFGPHIISINYKSSIRKRRRSGTRRHDHTRLFLPAPEANLGHQKNILTGHGYDR